MKLIALISFFDEDPSRLMECMNHVADLGATHVLMVDGAYKLYPDGSPSSGWFQFYATHEALLRKMGALFYAPQVVWENNEIEKRQTMLDLALTLAGPDDYLLIWDADWHIDGQALDLKPILSEYAPRYADMEITDAPQEDAGWWYIRMVYQAIRGMRYERNHYTIRFPDEDVTVSHPRDEELAKGFKLPVRVRHRPNDRPAERLGKQHIYYQRRHALGAEQ